MVVILIWAIVGIVSGLCCMLLVGFHMGKGIRQYLEVSFIGCVGGIVGGVLVQNVDICLSYLFGALYRETGFFTDGVLAGLLFALIISTFYFRALRPSTRKYIGMIGFLMILGISLVIIILLLLTVLARTPIEELYLIISISSFPLKSLPADTILVTGFAPLCGGWLAVLLIAISFQFSSISIVISPTPVNSLLLYLLVFLRNIPRQRHTTAYLRLGDHLGPVSSLSWSRNGKQLISISSHHVCISDTQTGETIYSHDPIVVPGTVNCSSQGFSLAVASQSVKVLHITGDMPFQITSSEGFTTSLVGDNVAPIWSPNGKFIALVIDGRTICICYAHNGKALLEYKEHVADVLALAWSPNGTLIASGDKEGTIHVWDTVLGTTSTTHKDHTGAIYTLAWSVDSKLVASGGDDKTIRTWDAALGKTIHRYQGHTATICALAWSPNSKMIASGSTDQTALLWNVETEKILTRHLAHTHAITAIAWSPNGLLIASGSRDTTVHIWRTRKVRK
ncbi:WD40 repeat domain-containing protein [Dictyobacter arantiisoli]|uniref:Uncharacterized protein n=1 Tax=Dictyobacter arantiisoli TaxID=2014874 RepID=A0A5A5TAH2_9CHLR|nr:WD40 repeat domain-containing protein [Dictyobacter arantiisoli]GCF08510.1 hypothetical protein KDI_20740 [Dictyobacter arantiisoli]